MVFLFPVWFLLYEIRVKCFGYLQLVKF